VGALVLTIAGASCQEGAETTSSSLPGSSGPPPSTAAVSTSPSTTTSLGTTTTIAPRPASGAPYVFVIVLENHSYSNAFGPASPSPYLSQVLPSEGRLLTNYYGIGHASLTNYIAMVSGQGPTADTQGDCVTYRDFTVTGPPAPNGQARGQGCVYPPDVMTVADQIDAAGLVWKGYMEDMANAPSEPDTCRHPALGSADPTVEARRGDQYATRHNPFVYFHSIIDDPAGCSQRVVPLDDLAADLASVATTPHFAFITPNLCNDGHDAPCVDGSPGGLTSAGAFLQQWVPRITSSPAFAEGGLLVITFDEADDADSTACCGEQPGPNVAAAGVDGPGGGRTGAVLLSTAVTAGSVDDTPYNHYSFLRTVEDIFGLDHLGFAAAPDVESFSLE
jgi:hypothetical protein